jgi:hypothetical protein
MKRVSTLLAASVALLLMTIAPAGAYTPSQDGTEARGGVTVVLSEFTASDAPDPGRDNVGMSLLSRTSDGLEVSVWAHDLVPGGMYTFWWVVPQDFTEDGPVLPGGVSLPTVHHRS